MPTGFPHIRRRCTKRSTKSAAVGKKRRIHLPLSALVVMAKRWESAVPCSYRRRDVWQYVFATTVLILSAIARHGALRSTAVRTILLLSTTAAVETAAGLASTGHGGGDPGVGPWVAASDSDRDEPRRAGFDDVGYAEILARVPERDRPAYQALYRAVEFHVRRWRLRTRDEGTTCSWACTS